MAVVFTTVTTWPLHALGMETFWLTNAPTEMLLVAPLQNRTVAVAVPDDCRPWMERIVRPESGWAEKHAPWLSDALGVLIATGWQQTPLVPRLHAPLHSHPSGPRPLQFLKVELHVKVQAPLAHDRALLLAVPQVLLHAPQLDVLVFVFVSQPSVVPVQSLNGAVHAS